MFTTVTDQPAAEYMSVEGSVGHLLIVRPLKYQQEGFVTEFRPEGTDVVFCDVADLDIFDDAGQPGKVFRGNTFLQGYLKGTFKRYVGHTLVGMIYLGAREKGKKPPFMWQDLSTDASVTARAMAWMTSNQGFLVQVSSSVPEVAGPPAYIPPAAPAATGAAVMSRPLNTLEQMRQMSQGPAAAQIDAPF